MTVYEFQPEARIDLDEIWDYIAAGSIDAADHTIYQILRRIRNLALFPHQEHRRTNLTNRPLRFIHVRDYLIAYAPDEKPLWVIAFMHGYRNPRVMAAILRGRE